MERFQLVARSLRGGLTECWHFGALAAVDAAGGRVATVGGPELPVFLRSAAKPLQAIAMLELGLEAFDLALVCASHGGCEVHATGARRLLEMRKLAPAALLCGAHEPLDATAARTLSDSGQAPSALHNNCSGKHAGMLLACVEAGLSLGDYVSAEHPLQRRIARTVARFCGVDEATLEAGVDGCSVPTHRVPLAAMARAYAALARPESLAEPADRERAERVYRAMTEAPEMVAGPGRFTTRLMEVGGGAILGKEGADGVYAVGVRGKRPFGLALKIADGTEVCRDGVVVDALRQLGALDADQARALEAFRTVPRMNRRGRKVGEVVPNVDLVHATA